MVGMQVAAIGQLDWRMGRSITAAEGGGMPEMKWVDENYLHDHALRKDHKPVLTLDKIEEWLKCQPRYMIQPDYSMKRNDKSRFVDVDDLLAQVQAWKADSK